MSPAALLLFAKAPIPGYAKTRLMPALGPKGAAKLHAQLVVHAVRTACRAKVGSRVRLYYSEPHPFFTSLAKRYPIELKPQIQGDLGARMKLALMEQPGPAIVLGTDCPVIDGELLRLAVDQLGRYDAVVLPAEDGGYGLIGVREARPRLMASLFDQMPWGTETVMNETRLRLAACGFTWAEPALIWDVDEAKDLERLATLEIAGRVRT